MNLTLLLISLFPLFSKLGVAEIAKVAAPPYPITLAIKNHYLQSGFSSNALTDSRDLNLNLVLSYQESSPCKP